MIVVCAWCVREGKPSLLRELGPEDGTVSHGICNQHLADLLAETETAKKRKVEGPIGGKVSFT